LSRISRSRGWFGALVLVCLLVGGGVATVLAQQQAQMAELFSSFMQKYSETPAFREKVLDVSRSVPKVGELLTPDMVRDLRALILGKHWQRVDRFPGFTIGTLNHSVALTMHVAGAASKPLTVAALLDVGAYVPGKAGMVDLDQEAAGPSYEEDPQTAVTQLAPGIVMGDGPDPALAPMHAQSLRLAEVLNRLALNAPGKPQLTVRLQAATYTDAGALIKALAASGEHVQVDDDLYFANFGHLHDHGRDVMMPFWLNTQIVVPASFRSLLLPVSHSEHELHVRGPLVNADVSYYFGIDGKSEFRTMDSLNQPWVLGRKAFVYHGERAAEAVNLLQEATRVYLALHLAHPELPFGGYYTLGVCQDTNAAIEEKLQGHVILFPLTHDPQYFPTNPAALGLAPRDGEYLRLLGEIPSDRGSAEPPVSRVLGALPTTNLDEIAIPGLAQDLKRVQQARSLGLVRRTHPLLTMLAVVLALIAAFCWMVAWLWRRLRNRKS
jgi:hypothetical protein